MNSSSAYSVRIKRLLDFNPMRLLPGMPLTAGALKCYGSKYSSVILWQLLTGPWALAMLPLLAWQEQKTLLHWLLSLSGIIH